MNSIEVIGNLVRIPNLREAKSGTTFATFSIASSRSREFGSPADFFLCSAFDDVATSIASLPKGAFVRLHGRVKSNVWTDAEGQKRYGVEIVVRSFERLAYVPPSGPTQGQLPL